MKPNASQALKLARATAAEIVAGRQPCPEFDDSVALLRQLKAAYEFGLARKLVLLLRKNRPDDAWLTQQLALCTYKDEELPPAARFARALELLREIGLGGGAAGAAGTLDPETRSETLGLAGAIYKRQFEHSGQLENLYQALACYRAAWDLDPAQDMGYGGGNAAFVLDLLAFRLKAVARRSGLVSAEAARLEAEARSMREQMAAQIPALAKDKEARKPERKHEQEYWYVATLAEIQFGLKNYEEAGRWLARAAALAPDEWERQTTFRQLATLARMQGHVPPAAGAGAATWSAPWRALSRLLEDDAEGAFSCWRGRVGLALSGGGFRASLFHLGVLARLAEMDVLRSVEVLSTVSGGSIVGAHYYLELRHHLNTHADAQITREDYVEIVRRVQKRFLKGIQHNLRTRALTNLGCNFKMLFPRLFGHSTYSRSHRIGELYESFLYSQVDDEHRGDSPRRMRSLRIQPAGVPNPEEFKPKFFNWRRRAKVPVLLLNTTSLNSGHNWHFTASWMGEPPGLTGSEVDANSRYRRLYYEQAPTPELRDYLLGHAVAASACVPGLFEPLAIAGLYPGRTVRLVDGGVHDNQGVEGLLDEACNFILCSDASGQMTDAASPSDGLLSVPLRTNSIFMDRVREAEYQDLKAREENRALHGLFFIHLKQDLNSSALDWIGCQDPGSEPARLNTTPYGIDRDIQRRLSALRTDLDSFTEVEAFALMASGYRMTEHQFKMLNARHLAEGNVGTWGDFDIHAARQSWPFLELEPILAKPQDSSDLRRRELERQLAIGSAAAFKVWHLVPALRVLGLALLGTAGLGLIAWVWLNWNQSIDMGTWPVGGIVISLLLFLAGLLVPALKLLEPSKAMRSWLMRVLLALLGCLVANLHVHLFDRFYLRYGRMARLMKLSTD